MTQSFFTSREKKSEFPENLPNQPVVVVGN